jgi:hypothetical protein
MHRFSTSLIISIVYDYDTLPRDDPLIAMVERCAEISVKELRPEVSAVVGEFPIRASFLLRPESVTQLCHTRSGETSTMVSWSKLCKRRHTPEIPHSLHCEHSVRTCEEAHGRYLLLVPLSFMC